MSLFPSGFNSPAALSGPCLVKYYVAASGPLANVPGTTLDTLEMCTKGSSSYNAIAQGNSQFSCDYTSAATAAGEAATIACGLAALNATLTSNSGTYTLYDAAVTQTYTAVTNSQGLPGVAETLVPTQLVVVPNAATISSLVVTTNAGFKAANVPMLMAALGVVSSLLFSGLF